jgi:uncharacterized protein (TIGR03089 family)
MDHAAQPHLRTISDLLVAVTRSEGHRPLLTCYDDMTGARTELSYATLDNWSAKTANLLVEEHDLRTGEAVVLDLDGHWTTAVLALACWKVGAVPWPRPRGSAATHYAAAEPAGARPALVCCHERHVDRYPDGPLVVVGDGLAADPLTAVPPRRGLTLLGEEVHAFADEYEGEVEPSTPAMATADHASLLTWAAAWRAVLGDGPRVGLAAPLDHPRAIDLLAGVLLARGSLVADRPPAHPPRWDRWSSERVNIVVGPAEVIDVAPTLVDVVAFDAVTIPA